MGIDFDNGQDTGAVHREILPGARNWSFILRRGYLLRLTDPRGGANFSALFYNATEKLERYNMADTLKAQHTARLTRGHVCYSDMGRILVSIVEDTCGWHDPIGGVSDAALVEARYGAARYQEQRNAFHRNGRELFLIELGKWGLGRRDLVPCVNFFSKVTVDASGGMHLAPASSSAGDYVDLRAEKDVIVVISNCPQEHNPCSGCRPTPIRLIVLRPA